MTILSISQLSVHCTLDACVECRDPDCLCHCHETADLEPLVLTAEQDDASWLAEDCRAKRLADR